MRNATLGKVLGAVGLLLLFSSPVTYFITTGTVALAVGKAVLGLLLIGAYFATNYGQIGQFASRRSTYFVVSTVVLAVVVLGALAAANVIAAKRNKSWDLTRKKIYSLAPQTVTTLQELKSPVKAIAFVPSNHPYYEALENLLSRYRGEAPDRFDFTFEDARRRPDLAQRYQLKEGQTTVVLTRGEGEDAAHTSLNVLSEQELTNALIKLNGVGQQKVYFVTGHGEWPLDPAGDNPGGSLSELRRSLAQEGYTPEPLQLAGQPEVPRDATAVILAGPQVPLTEGEVAALRRYLEQGGRFLYFSDVNRNPGPAFDKLLADHGVEVDAGMIADDRYAVDSPYMPLSLFYGEHEATRMLAQLQISVQLPTVRGLTLLRQGTLQGVEAKPLVLSSPYAWVETTPDGQPAPDSGEKTGQIPLVAAITRPTASAEHKRFDELRMVVFGDSELLVDANWGHEGNRNLVMNALGWASNQVSRITIRPPDRDVSTLELDETTLGRIRFVTTDLLPISLLAVGVAIWLKRRNQ